MYSRRTPMNLLFNLENRETFPVTNFTSTNTIKDIKNFIEPVIKKQISVFYNDTLLNDEFVLGELSNDNNLVPLLHIFAKGHLFVKLSSGQRVILDYDPNQTVAQLRTIFYNKVENPTYKLIFNNEVMKDECKLSDYGVGEDCFIYLDMGPSV